MNQRLDEEEGRWGGGGVKSITLLKKCQKCNKFIHKNLKLNVVFGDRKKFFQFLC